MIFVVSSSLGFFFYVIFNLCWNIRSFYTLQKNTIAVVKLQIKYYGRINYFLLDNHPCSFSVSHILRDLSSRCNRYVEDYWEMPEHCSDSLMMHVLFYFHSPTRRESLKYLGLGSWHHLWWCQYFNPNVWR